MLKKIYKIVLLLSINNVLSDFVNYNRIDYSRVFSIKVFYTTIKYTQTKLEISMKIELFY